MAAAFEKVACSAAAQDACFIAAKNWPHEQQALPVLYNPAFSQQDWQTDELNSEWKPIWHVTEQSPLTLDA